MTAHRPTPPAYLIVDPVHLPADLLDPPGGAGEKPNAAMLTASDGPDHVDSNTFDDEAARTKTDPDGDPSELPAEPMPPNDSRPAPAGSDRTNPSKQQEFPMPPIVPTYLIDLIQIYPDGVRRARVIHPESGVTVWHGLGLVGERLLLGLRAGEYRALKLPRRPTRKIYVPAHSIEMPADLVIVSVDRRGRTTVATFADLRAAVEDGAA